MPFFEFSWFYSMIHFTDPVLSIRNYISSCIDLKIVGGIQKPRGQGWVGRWFKNFQFCPCLTWKCPKEVGGWSKKCKIMSLRPKLGYVGFFNKQITIGNLIHITFPKGAKEASCYWSSTFESSEEKSWKVLFRGKYKKGRQRLVAKKIQWKADKIFDG